MDPDELTGETLTCNEINYYFKMGKINELTGLRLVLERLNLLEIELDNIKRINNLKDK